MQIQAEDPDRDQITYAFLDSDGYEKTTLEMFEIDPDNGKISKCQLADKTSTLSPKI